MATLRDYYNTSYDDYTGVYGATWKAESYLTTSEYSATSVKIRIYRIGDLTGRTLTLSLKAVDGLGKPTGDDLAVGTYDPSALTTEDVDGAMTEITFSTPYVVTNATTYAIVVRLDGGDNSNSVRWKLDSGEGYENGNIILSTDSGATWTVGSSIYDLIFEVWGNDAQQNLELICAVGAITLTGQTSILERGYTLVCAVANIVLTGIIAILTKEGWNFKTKNTATYTNKSKNSSSYSYKVKN